MRYIIQTFDKITALLQPHCFMANFDGFYEKAKSTKVYTMDRLYRPYFFVIDDIAQAGITPVLPTTLNSTNAFSGGLFSWVPV